MTNIIPVPSSLLATKAPRRLAPRSLGDRRMAALAVVVALLAALLAPASTVRGQQAPPHLNPSVEKLAHGQPIVGVQTDDMSLQNCDSLGGIDSDYADVDMEHWPLTLDGLAYCMD